MNDTQLVQQFQAGDVAAFNRLVERWQHRIHRFALRYFAGRDEAREITQKTFIKAYREPERHIDPHLLTEFAYIH